MWRTPLLRSLRYGLVAVLAAAAALLFYERWPGEAAIAPQPASYRAVDGDSLRNGNGDIRLIGIDAPELLQRCRKNGKEWACGRAAQERLKQLVARSDVRCAPQGRDRYGRTLARCSAGGTDLGDTMVSEGLALNFMQGGYERHEREARIAKRGIWAGEFDFPQEHRQRPRASRN
jgi:endonuclease YncB( thermonuclease family)